VKASLYLHIPFCGAKCDYCDFYSIPLPDITSSSSDDLVCRYLDALVEETNRRIDELEAAGGSPLEIPSIYIGGGTPSILGPKILRIFADVIRVNPCKSVDEITVEANPESCDAAFLEACIAGGATRLSLGVQSFNPELRAAVGRRGDAALLDGRLSLAAQAFGGGLSLDLMTGLPGQTEDDVRADIEKALAFNPGHVSLYSLTVEEGTPLFQKISHGGHGEKEDAEDAVWLYGRDMLVKAGYEHYEVSNFARPGRRCLHNIRYWRMENWLGVGCAASGTIIDGSAPGAARGLRTSYRNGVEAFIANPASCLAAEELDRLTLIKESLMMGYRYVGGPDADLFRSRFGLSIEEAIPRTLEKWRGRDKMLFLNRFLADAFEELEINHGPHRQNEQL